jgi:DNA-binding NtrC family response regulator
MPLQAKFLRVLQEKEFRRIGETTTRKLDVQVIAATNKQLSMEVRGGKFREDLYYRLKEMEIKIPPLRERREDISLLIDRFLALTAQIEGGKAKRFSPEALEILQNDPFPGNIRELISAVKSSYYLARGMIIEVENLPEDIRLRGKASEGADLEKASGSEIYQRIRKGMGSFEQLVKMPLAERKFGTKVVKEVIRGALSDSGGRYKGAFRLLRIPDEQYPVIMVFLKRNDCYVDYRPFRKKPKEPENPDQD